MRIQEACGDGPQGLSEEGSDDEQDAHALFLLASTQMVHGSGQRALIHLQDPSRTSADSVWSVAPCSRKLKSSLASTISAHHALSSPLEWCPTCRHVWPEGLAGAVAAQAGSKFA